MVVNEEASVILEQSWTKGLMFFEDTIFWAIMVEHEEKYGCKEGKMNVEGNVEG
jgi:hypothetical protein